MNCYHFSLEKHEVGTVLDRPWVIIGDEDEVRKKPYVPSDSDGRNYDGEYLWMHYLGNVFLLKIDPDPKIAD